MKKVKNQNVCRERNGKWKKGWWKNLLVTICAICLLAGFGVQSVLADKNQSDIAEQQIITSESENDSALMETENSNNLIEGFADTEEQKTDAVQAVEDKTNISESTKQEESENSNNELKSEEIIGDTSTDTELDTTSGLGADESLEDTETVIPSRTGAVVRKAASVNSSIQALTSSAANDWQIASEGYQGNDLTNKTGHSSLESWNDVWIQKNVAPTDQENEFLIYLSIAKRAGWNELLQHAEFKITTSNRYHSHAIGTIERIVGNPSSVSQDASIVSGTNQYTGTIVYTRSGQTIATETGITFYGSTPNCSNATGFISINGVEFLASRSVTLKNDGGGTGGTLTFTLDLDALENAGIIFTYPPVKLDQTVDILGDQMVYDGLEYSDGTVSYDENSKTLTWDIEETSSASIITDSSGSGLTGYYNNIAQLVYRVKLDVTKENFNSCASNMNSTVSDPESYPTNQRATLTYYRKNSLLENQDPYRNPVTVDYPIPYVRGLLYDYQIRKVDEDADPLAGAKFTFTGRASTTGLSYQDYSFYDLHAASAVPQADTQTGKLMTDADGWIKITGLPCGSYQLQEVSAPAGHELPDDAVLQFTVCYTDARQNYEQSSLKAEDQILSEVKNTPPTITNYKYRQIVLRKSIKGIAASDAEVLQKIINSTTYYVHLQWTEADGNVKTQIIAIPLSDFSLDASTGEYVYQGDQLNSLPHSTVFYVIETTQTGDISADEIRSYYLYDTTSVSEDITGNTVIGSEKEEMSIAKDGTEEPLHKVRVVSFQKEYRLKVTAVKIWKDSGNAYGMRPRTVSFQLYRTLNGTREKVGEEVSVGYDENDDPVSGTVVADENTWNYVWENLPSADAGGNAYVFSVEETDVPEKYQMTISEDQMTVTNSLLPTLQIVKSGKDSGPLEGVEFALYRDEETAPVQTGSTDQQGYLEFTDLEDGTYYLRELKTASGYILPGSGWIVKAAGGKIAVSEEADKKELSVQQDTNDKTLFVVNIMNEPAGKLPSAGGGGTIYHYIVGGALIAFAITPFLLLLQKRKEKDGK